jgi:AcrR family transcriptional regulator
MDRASLRADAAGNRARIITAARAAIANRGEVKLNAIARQAGVGQGTLYRHFPTRDDLLAEVYREDVGELVAAAPALLATHEPLTALARWLDRVADYAQVKRGVFAAVEAGVSQDLATHSLGPIGEALTGLLDAGKADGTIRPDVDARDVILLIGYLTRLEQSEWDARARHLLQVILDGLRARDRGRRDPGQACRAADEADGQDLRATTP